MEIKIIAYGLLALWGFGVLSFCLHKYSIDVSREMYVVKFSDTGLDSEGLNRFREQWNKVINDSRPVLIAMNSQIEQIHRIGCHPDCNLNRDSFKYDNENKFIDNRIDYPEVRVD